MGLVFFANIVPCCVQRLPVCGCSRRALPSPRQAGGCWLLGVTLCQRLGTAVHQQRYTQGCVAAGTGGEGVVSAPEPWQRRFPKSNAAGKQHSPNAPLPKLSPSSLMWFVAAPAKDTYTFRQASPGHSCDTQAPVPPCQAAGKLQDRPVSHGAARCCTAGMEHPVGLRPGLAFHRTAARGT